MNWKSTLKSIVKSTISFCIVAVLAIQAPFLHKSFLRNVGESNSVKIVGMDGTGSGFHVKTKSGKVYILTNRHVCMMTGPLKVEKYGTKSGKGTIRKIVSISKKHDLCVLEALPEMEGIELGSSAKNGESVYILGHPRGVALTVSSGEKIDDLPIEIGEPLSEDGKCKGEIVMSFFGNYCVTKQDAVQFSNPTYPGNSGSPVVDKWGKLVSVVFAGSPSVENQGFGVPLDYITSFLSELK